MASKHKSKKSAQNTDKNEVQQHEDASSPTASQDSERMDGGDESVNLTESSERYVTSGKTTKNS